jgi:hypothetical protein
MTTLADSSLLQSLKEEDPSLSLEELLVPALHPTSWDLSFVLRALSFLDECTNSPSFIQRDFPAEFVKYGFSPLVLPPFEEMVNMAQVLDYLGFSVSSLQPLVREVTDCVEFSSSDLHEFPLFSLKEIDSFYFLPFLASNGFLSLVQRAYPDEEKTFAVCSAAARNGQFDVLRWLRAQDPPCPWDIWACARATQNGHLEIVQWLRAQDPPCPWDIWVCAFAAENGHLDVLKWLRSQDPPCPWDERVCAFAARNGHLNVLQWVRAQKPPCPWNSDWCLQWGTNKVRTWIWIQEHL